jgi:hypothetical protein
MAGADAKAFIYLTARIFGLRRHGGSPRTQLRQTAAPIPRLEYQLFNE